MDDYTQQTNRTMDETDNELKMKWVPRFITTTVRIVVILIPSTATSYETCSGDINVNDARPRSARVNQI